MKQQRLTEILYIPTEAWRPFKLSSCYWVIYFIIKMFSSLSVYLSLCCLLGVISQFNKRQSDDCQSAWGVDEFQYCRKTAKNKRHAAQIWLKMRVGEGRNAKLTRNDAAVMKFSQCYNWHWWKHFNFLCQSESAKWRPQWRATPLTAARARLYCT